MIDITQWRVSIGLWHSCRIPTKHATSSKLMESLGVIEDENGGNNIVFRVLLILSGDIELNPGPETDILNKAPSLHEIFDLLADINEKWERIALALQTPQNVLHSLQHSTESNIVKLFEVLDTCIKNTQSSPVTWETIISAIEGPIVNNKRKADKIRKYLGFQMEQPEKESTDFGAVAAQETNSQMGQEEKQSTDFGAIASQESKESRKRQLHEESSSSNSSKKHLKGSTDTCVSMPECTETDKEVNVDNAFKLLVDQCGFEPSCWYELAHYLKVPYEKRRQIEAKRNDRIKLEDSLYCWITNTDQPSWAELIEAVEKCEMPNVATKMREALRID